MGFCFLVYRTPCLALCVLCSVLYSRLDRVSVLIFWYHVSLITSFFFFYIPFFSFLLLRPHLLGWILVGLGCRSIDLKWEDGLKNGKADIIPTKKNKKHRKKKNKTRTKDKAAAAKEHGGKRTGWGRPDLCFLCRHSRRTRQDRGARDWLASDYSQLFKACFHDLKQDPVVFLPWRRLLICGLFSVSIFAIFIAMLHLVHRLPQGCRSLQYVCFYTFCRVSMIYSAALCLQRVKPVHFLDKRRQWGVLAADPLFLKGGAADTRRA